jgi:hypothetical protein
MRMRTLRDITLALAVIGLLGACDSPIEPVSHAVGVVIVSSNGSEAARFMYNNADPIITGELEVDVQETVTYHVRGVDEDGAVFSLGDGGYSISGPVVVIGLRANVSVQGVDELVLEGLDPGSTTVRFILNHGGHGAEFEVEDIPLIVG